MTTSQIERVLPLAEAAQRMGISAAALTRLVRSGKIRALQLPDGSLGVSKRDAEQLRRQIAVNEQLKAITRDQFKKLRGQPITISQASGSYGVPGTTLRDWVKRGYVRVIDAQVYPLELDQADVAYCATIHRVRSHYRILRAPLLDESGSPYQLKHPELSEYRRRKKEAQTTL